MTSACGALLLLLASHGSMRPVFMDQIIFPMFRVWSDFFFFFHSVRKIHEGKKQIKNCKEIKSKVHENPLINSLIITGRQTAFTYSPWVNVTRVGKQTLWTLVIHSKNSATTSCVHLVCYYFVITGWPATRMPNNRAVVMGQEGPTDPLKGVVAECRRSHAVSIVLKYHPLCVQTDPAAKLRHRFIMAPLCR